MYSRDFILFFYLCLLFSFIKVIEFSTEEKGVLCVHFVHYRKLWFEVKNFIVSSSRSIKYLKWWFWDVSILINVINVCRMDLWENDISPLHCLMVSEWEVFEVRCCYCTTYILTFDRPLVTRITYRQTPYKK